MNDILEKYSVEQGWDAQSEGALLMGYIIHCVAENVVPDEISFAAYLTEAAEEENS